MSMVILLNKHCQKELLVEIGERRMKKKGKTIIREVAGPPQVNSNEKTH